MRVVWYNGEWAPPYDSVDGVDLPPFGTLYFGAGGHLLHNVATGQALVMREGKSPCELAPAVVETGPAGFLHRESASHHDSAATVDLVVEASLMAYRAQQPLEWDGARFRAYNGVGQKL
jgi:hypothetical protein